MQISVEKTSNSARKINIVIPMEQINAEIKEKINKFGREVKLNGFRPGRVPISVIKQKYGPAIYQEVIENLIDSELNRAIMEHKLDLIGEVNLESINNPVDNFENTEDLKCIFTARVYPEFELKELSELNINTFEVKITEEDVNDYLEVLKKELGNYVEVVDYEANIGDLLNIDYENHLQDGQKLDGSYKNIEILLGSNSFMEGFESGLIGAKKGDDIVLNLTFPDDYPEKSLANIPVEVRVHVNTVKVKQLAAIDKEFAYKLGIKDINENNNDNDIDQGMELKDKNGIVDITQIREVVKKNLLKYVENLISQQEEINIKSILLESYPIDELPDKLVQQEFNQLQTNLININKKDGINIKELNDKLVVELQMEARKNVHLSLILRKIIQKYDDEIDKGELNAKLDVLDKMFKEKSAIKNKEFYYNLRNSIMNSHLFKIIMDFIRQKITKNSISTTLKELTG